MIKVTLFVIGLACAYGFASYNETGSDIPGLTPNALVIAQVASEKALSQSFLDALLRMQHAQHWGLAGSSFSQAYSAFAQGLEKSGSSDASLEELGDEDFEEDSLLELASKLYKRKAHQTEEQALEEMTALPFFAPQQPEPTTTNPGAQALSAAYHLYYGIKLDFFRTLSTASNLQEKFWAIRAWQLSVQALAGANPQLTQYLYLLSYKTQLETLKLSYKLQTISHFTMWLEDEIDAKTAIRGPNGDLEDSQVSELITDKEFAFNAYNTFAMIDYQIFYLDMYLASAGAAIPSTPSASANANAANANVAMLEEESQAEPAATTFFAPQNGPWFYQYKTMLQLYQVLLQLYGANAALTSVNAEKVAHEKLTDSSSSNDKEGFDSLKFSFQTLASFGQNIAQAAQIEQLLATFDLWALYAPAFAAPPAAANKA